jgi:hypothetical protein
LDNKEIFLFPIICKLDEKLNEYRFSSAEKDSNDGYEIYEWKRNRKLFCDKVKMVFTSSTPTYFYLSLSINLIVSNNEIIIKHIPVSDLMHSNSEYRLPMLFKKLKSSQLITNIINDVIHSLKWFEQIASKEDCLEIIESGQAGITKEGTLYPAVIRFLNS